MPDESELIALRAAAARQCSATTAGGACGVIGCTIPAHQNAPFATNAWWEERQRKVIEAAKQMAATWRAENPDRKYPDLDFRCPDCPMCLEETTHEDGQFICEVCHVAWPRSGYGHEAEFIGEATDA